MGGGNVWWGECVVGGGCGGGCGGGWGATLVSACEFHLCDRGSISAICRCLIIMMTGNSVVKVVIYSINLFGVGAYQALYSQKF